MLKIYRPNIPSHPITHVKLLNITKERLPFLSENMEHQCENNKILPVFSTKPHCLVRQGVKLWLSLSGPNISFDKDEFV